MLKDAFRELSNEIILEWLGGRISKISTQYTNHDFNSPIFSWGTAHYSSLGAIAEFWLCHEKNIPDSPPEALWHSYVPLLPISSYLQVGFLQSPPPLLICWWRLIPTSFPLKTMWSPPIPPFSRYLLTAPLTLKSHFFQQELRLNLQDQEVNV